MIIIFLSAIGCTRGANVSRQKDTAKKEKQISGERKTQPQNKPKIIGKSITKKINIFLANQKKEDEAYAKHDPESKEAYQFAFPVPRIIETTAETLQQDTVKELLKGLTDGEEEQGYKTEIHNLSLDSLKISDGVATVKLNGKKFYLEGDMSGPRLRAQVEKTLLQFTDIKEVVIFVNGNSKFDDLSG